MSKEKKESRIPVKAKLIILAVLLVIAAGVYVYMYQILPRQRRKQMLDYDNLKPGDHMLFGAYEQDDKTSNGLEDIEWLILDQDGDKYFVISYYALVCKPYTDDPATERWDQSPLRTWLNDDFYNQAFTAEEQAMILETNVPAHNIPQYEKDPGEDTVDRIYLLSNQEAEHYFATFLSKYCETTPYARVRGDYTDCYDDSCWWWLRTPGVISNDASHIYDDLHVFYNGVYIQVEAIAVRPCMWIDLSKK